MSGWTIQQYLNRITQYLTEKHIDSPRLEAELLMSQVLRMQRIDLYTQFEKEVSRKDSKRLEELVQRASEHEPIAYLIGRKEFYSQLGLGVGDRWLGRLRGLRHWVRSGGIGRSR